jgi:hemoglobin/transferrin/lactoferrin receptor protein
MGKVFDSSSSDGKVIVPNPDLKPEKTLGVELHADWKIGDAVRVTPSVYYTYLFDAIALARATSVDSIKYEGVMCPAYANFNARRAYIVGASLNVDANLCKDLTLNARYTYTYGRILNYPVDDVMTEGETCVAPLDHIAPAYGRIGLRYTPKAWDFEVWSLWNARKKLKDYATEGEDNITYATVNGRNGDGMPAWFTLNARVGYDLKCATVRVGVDNILDTLYRTFGSGINATGRNFYVSLTYNW